MDLRAPLFQQDLYTEEQKRLLAPFFTNLDQSVYVPLIFAPELIGALCSRASRAKGDLRKVFLDEFIVPFLSPVRTEKDTDATWEEKVKYGKELHAFIDFLQGHSIANIFSNPRARSFYVTWLAQYGDDSIAQMAGMHVGYAALSQVAIKHLEDQRIGLAPIEKSTRYVDYSQKIQDQYMYYIDPTLKEWGLEQEYKNAMDGLFNTYVALLPKLKYRLSQKFPEEKQGVIEKKAFDILRGLLPAATLSQVAFFGNGQSFEHMVNRSLGHSLGEIRWAGMRADEELQHIAPAFLRRLHDEEKGAAGEAYQKYLQKGKRMASVVKNLFEASGERVMTSVSRAEVRLVEYDPEGEMKIIAGMLYSTSNNHRSWEDIMKRVRAMRDTEKRNVVSEYLQGRTARWQKAGRAFENAYVRFEIIMNIGAWRDLHRHRMLTQQRQNFSSCHGYDLPHELVDAKLDADFRAAIERAEAVYEKIAARDADMAQYAVTLAHRVRFMQWENLRECFWEIELRTIPEGHPDYRHVEQQKFYLLQKVYPVIAEHILVNVGEYDFARRGQEEKIQEKFRKLTS